MTKTENIINQSKLESIKKLSLDEKQKIISFLENKKEADDKNINFLNSNFNLVTPIIDSMTEVVKYYLETGTSDYSSIIEKYSDLEQINEAIKTILLQSDINQTNKVKIIELMIKANEKYNENLNEILKSKEQNKRNIVIVGIVTLLAIFRGIWNEE